MKLGKTQIDILRCLREHGSWSRGCGWYWDNNSGTERLLNSLVKRGLARIVEEKITTRHGLKMVQATYYPTDGEK